MTIIKHRLSDPSHSNKACVRK